MCQLKTETFQPWKQLCCKSAKNKTKTIILLRFIGHLNSNLPSIYPPHPSIHPSTVLITFFFGHVSELFCLDSDWLVLYRFVCLMVNGQMANGKWRWHDEPKYLMASFLRLMKFSCGLFTNQI